MTKWVVYDAFKKTDGGIHAICSDSDEVSRELRRQDIDTDGFYAEAVKLNAMEQFIVKKMIQHFGKTQAEAELIVLKYLNVIRLLDEKHDGAWTQADMYVKADAEGLEPFVWEDHIYKTREKYKNDTGKCHVDKESRE